MKDRRIWIVIGCILMIGISVTRYTSSYIKREVPIAEGYTAYQEEKGLTAAAPETTGSQPLVAEAGPEEEPALGSAALEEEEAPSLPGESRETPDQAGAESTASQETEALTEAAPAEAAAPSSETVFGSEADAILVSPRGSRREKAETEETEPSEGSQETEAEPQTSMDAGVSLAMAEPSAEDTSSAAEPEGGAPGLAARSAPAAPAARGETGGAAGQPAALAASPLDETKKAADVVDYKKRLEDLSAQIKKLRSEESGSNVYSIKTSAETELKMWEGEMNTIYNALLECLSEEDAAALVQEQQEWLKDREAQAADNSGKNSAGMEGIEYTAAMVSLTKDRAYELADRYEEANEPSEETETAGTGETQKETAPETSRPSRSGAKPSGESSAARQKTEKKNDSKRILDK